PSEHRRRSPAITRRSQSWFRSRPMTTHPVIGGAKDTLLGTYRQVSGAAPRPSTGERGLALEASMAILKRLMMVGAMLVAGAFLAVAQNSLPTEGQAPLTSGAAGNAAAPGPAASPATASPNVPHVR